MIYMLDILTLIFVMATGFSTSWVVVEIIRLAGRREPVRAGLSGSPARIGLELALAALTGPRLLLVNGFQTWRNGLVSLPLYGVVALVAAGWSVCSGVIVLELAFATGFFLA